MTAAISTAGVTGGLVGRTAGTTPLATGPGAPSGATIVGGATTPGRLTCATATWHVAGPGLTNGRNGSACQKGPCAARPDIGRRPSTAPGARARRRPATDGTVAEARGGATRLPVAVRARVTAGGPGRGGRPTSCGRATTGRRRPAYGGRSARTASRPSEGTRKGRGRRAFRRPPAVGRGPSRRQAVPAEGGRAAPPRSRTQGLAGPIKTRRRVRAGCITPWRAIGGLGRNAAGRPGGRGAVEEGCVRLPSPGRAVVGAAAGLGGREATRPGSPGGGAGRPIGPPVARPAKGPSPRGRVASPVGRDAGQRPGGRGTRNGAAPPQGRAAVGATTGRRAAARDGRPDAAKGATPVTAKGRAARPRATATRRATTTPIGVSPRAGVTSRQHGRRPRGVGARAAETRPPAWRVLAGLDRALGRGLPRAEGTGPRAAGRCPSGGRKTRPASQGL